MEILENALVIQETQWLKYIFMMLGLLLLAIGVGFFKKIPPKTNYILPIFGGLFLTAGVLFWFTEHNITLTIKPKQVEIAENLGNTKLTTKLPMTEFSHLEVLKHIHISENNQNSSSQSISFVLQMMRKNGSPLQILTSQNLDKIYAASQKLQTLSNLKLYVILGQTSEDKAFVEKFERLKNTEVSETYPIVDFKLAPYKSSQHTLPSGSLLTEVNRGKNIFLYWKNRQNIVPVLLFGSIVFLFFFLMHKVVIPSKGWKVSIIAGYIFLCILSLVWFLTFIFSIFGKSTLILREDSLSYQTNIFGQVLYQQNMQYKNIASITNELNPNQAGTLQIFSHKGYKLFQNLATKKPENILSSLLDVAFNLKSYITQIDVSVLTVAERLYLEQKIEQQIHKLY